LIESDPCAPFAKLIVKKIFACVDVDVTRDAEEKSMRTRKISSCRFVERTKMRIQEVLILSGVLQFL